MKNQLPLALLFTLGGIFCCDGGFIALCCVVKADAVDLEKFFVD